LGQDVNLSYPSVVCVYTGQKQRITLQLGKGSKVAGAIVLSGNNLFDPASALLRLEPGSEIVGQVYSSGTLYAMGKIKGQAMTARISAEYEQSDYPNILMGIDIDAELPKSFLPIPIFDQTPERYGIAKRLY